MAEYQGYDPNPKHFFGEITPQDEFVHPIPPEAGFEWTETNMFGFNIPEHNIDCLIYLWHHPVLKVTYGGVTIWQGKKASHLEAEACDFRSVMPMPKEPTDATYPMGLTIKCLEPLKKFHITYKHVNNDAELDLTLNAVMPPAARHTGNHFTQVMRTDGTLILRGTHYKINGLHSRDRSWGEHRAETPFELPPMSWMVGVFDEDFAFHISAFESRERHPEWGDLYPQMAGGGNTLWGYVRLGGKTLGVTSAEHYVHRDPDGIRPERIELLIRTEDGGEYPIIGTVKSLVPQPGWPNMTYFMGLTEWRSGEKVGYGDIQDVNWGPHMRRFRKSV